MAVGAGVAGFAGSVNGAYYQGVFPDTFMFPLLITVYAMVILGGAGSLGGVAFGAVVVNVLLEVLRTPDHARWVFYAALILGLLAEAPAVAAARRAAGWPRDLRRRRARDRRRRLGSRRGRPDRDRADVVHDARFSRDGHPPLDGAPERHLHSRELQIGNYAFVIVIALVLTCTVLKGWKR